MKLLRNYCLPAILSLLIMSGQAQTTQILFIGNSITASGIPDVVKDLALAGGDSVYTELFWNGQLLRDYTTDPGAKSAVEAKLNERSWDYVVLQENSQVSGFFPGWTQYYFEYYSYNAARTLNNLIRANNSCTETVFFMTYGYITGDQTNFPNDDYFKMQGRITRNYLMLADSFSSTVAPVGVAWQKIMSDYSFGNQLYLPGDHHPSDLGVYLASCVFYATLFQKSPVGLGYYYSLTPNKATFMQAIADTIVRQDSNDWNININKPMADFTYSYQATKLQFSANTKSRYKSYWWDFGDSTNSKTKSPVHQFDSAGKYYWVKHIQTSNCYLPDTQVQQLLYCPPARAGFDFHIGPNRRVTFSNFSFQATHYLWKFGDGTTDTSTNPVHTFDTSKFFIVCLFASNNCSVDTFCVPIEVILSGKEEITSAFPVNIFPSPGNGKVKISSGNTFIETIGIYNSIGGLVCHFDQKEAVDLSGYPNGIYWIALISGNKKVVVGYMKTD